MSYTNHTILFRKTLEKWDAGLFKNALPRVYQIILEIDNRFVAGLAQKGIDPQIIENTRIVKDNQIHMANLAIIGGHLLMVLRSFIQNCSKKIPCMISIPFILKIQQ